MSATSRHKVTLASTEVARKVARCADAGRPTIMRAMRYLILVVALLATGCGGSSPSAPTTAVAVLPSSLQATAMCTEPSIVSRHPTVDASVFPEIPTAGLKLGSSSRGGAWMARVSWLASTGDLHVGASTVDAATPDLIVSAVTMVGQTAQQDLCWSSAPGLNYTVDVRVTAFRAPRVDVHVDAWVP